MPRRSGTVSWLEHEEETISVDYASGTTGRPKGVQYTYRGAYLNALNEVIVAGMSADSVYLWTLPMFHCNGWCFTWAVTAAAARHVTMRAMDAQRVWELIDSEGVTHYTPPCSNARSSGYPTRTGERPKAFVTLNEGAAPTAAEIIAFCRERLAHCKCPDAVEFGPLPKTSTGKIQKFVLRDREWTDQDVRIGRA